MYGPSPCGRARISLAYLMLICICICFFNFTHSPGVKLKFPQRLGLTDYRKYVSSGQIIFSLLVVAAVAVAAEAVVATAVVYSNGVSGKV